MCSQRSINSVNSFSEAKEPSVVHVIGCDVIMVMPSFSVITEAVKVFNAQVQALIKKNSNTSIKKLIRIIYVRIYIPNIYKKRRNAV